MKKRNLIKTLLTIAAVFVMLLVLIANVPALQEVVPDKVVGFAQDWANTALAALMLVVGILLLGTSVVVGVAFIVIGAIIIYSNLRNRRQNE